LIHLAQGQAAVVISLDSKFHKKTCNLFALLYGKIITAELSGTISIGQTEDKDGVRKQYKTTHSAVLPVMAFRKDQYTATV